MDNVLRIPDPIAKVLLPFAVESVRLANDYVPYKWGLTPLDSGFRLNVGFCEVFTVGEFSVRVIFHRDYLDLGDFPESVQIEHTYSGAEYYYVSAPGSSLITIPLDLRLLRKILPRIREAHSQTIKVASRKSFNLGARRGHKDWVVDALSKATNSSIPYPQYSPLFQLEDQDFSRSEGNPKLRQHYVLERRPEIVREKKRLFRLEHGHLFCEACGDDLVGTYGEIAEDCFEVHHIIPLSQLRSSSSTQPKDLAILCPNCHAVIHKIDPILTLQAFRRQHLGR